MMCTAAFDKQYISSIWKADMVQTPIFPIC